MITVDNWSDLVTINYQGGMGGDFFSSILNKNFSVDQELLHNDKFVYDFYYGDLAYQKFKSISSFFIPRQYDDKSSREYIKQLDKLHKKIYCENNVNQTIINIRNYIVENYVVPSDTKKVMSLHNYSNIATLQDIFPKSINIFLCTKDSNYLQTTKLLFMFKKIVPILKIDSNNKLVTPFSVHQQTFDSVDLLFNDVMNDRVVSINEYFIDMHDLIVRQCSCDDILSELCNQKIVLDKKLIQLYKNQTKEIMLRYNINIDTDYDTTSFNNKIYNAFIGMLKERPDLNVQFN